MEYDPTDCFCIFYQIMPFNIISYYILRRAGNRLRLISGIEGANGFLRFGNHIADIRAF